MKIKITAIILTYNEELNIENCLKSLKGWIDEIIILDSNSTDSTLDIAESYTKKIFFHDFETHSKQWKWALENLPIKNEWVIGLDSDQSVSEGLKSKLLEVFKEKVKGVDGYYVRRKQIFMGKWIKYGGYYPKYLLKIFNKDKVLIDENELVDHHFYVEGNTEVIEEDIVEDNINERNLSFWFKKHINYAELFANEAINKYRVPEHRELTGPDKNTKFMKNIYGSLPLFIRPFLYFICRYFFQLGFLDGTRGFIFHFFHALCFRFIVDAKIYELKKSKQDKN
ncbi:MAG: glycosyltransferase family 2 protein [Thermodesulfobacteriota bacterium]